MNDPQNHRFQYQNGLILNDLGVPYVRRPPHGFGPALIVPHFFGDQHGGLAIAENLRQKWMISRDHEKNTVATQSSQMKEVLEANGGLTQSVSFLACAVYTLVSSRRWFGHIVWINATLLPLIAGFFWSTVRATWIIVVSQWTAKSHTRLGISRSYI